MLIIIISLNSIYSIPILYMGFPGGSVVKNLPANADVGSSPELERSPGEEIGSPLQYSCLGNPLDRRTKGSQRVRHNLATGQQILYVPWKKKSSTIHNRQCIIKYVLLIKKWNLVVKCLQRTQNSGWTEQGYNLGLSLPTQLLCGKNMQLFVGSIIFCF